jgi:hypothetical protein
MKQTYVQKFDDLSGTMIPEGEGETIEFAFEGVSYEIDLNKRNAGNLKRSLEKYLKAARKVETRKATAYVRKTRNVAKIREWAHTNGMPVGDRGRIAAPIREAYEKVHSA